MCAEKGFAIIAKGRKYMKVDANVFNIVTIYLPAQEDLEKLLFPFIWGCDYLGGWGGGGRRVLDFHRPPPGVTTIL